MNNGLLSIRVNDWIAERMMMKILVRIILFLRTLVEILVIKVCASYTQLPLQHHINLGSTFVNIGRMNLIPTLNLILTTFHTFLPLTVLPETSIPWRYEPTEHILHTTPTILYWQGFYSRQYWSCKPDSKFKYDLNNFAHIFAFNSFTWNINSMEVDEQIVKHHCVEPMVCPEVLDFCISRYFPNSVQPTYMCTLELVVWETSRET